MIAPSVALLALGALAVSAQQATDLDLQYEQAQFTQSLLVPDLLASFSPSAVLTVQFNTSDSPAEYGAALTINDVAAQPDITVAGAGNFSADGAFTVAMVDPGVAGADQSEGQTRHWLVNNVFLTPGNDETYTLNFTTDAITTYGGPYPADGSGPHRYTILLLPQPESFTAPADLSTPGVAISTFDFPAYVTDSGLGEPVAGWYMTVEQGTSTVSVASTAAVESSTLAAAAATTSGGAAASASSGASAASSGAVSAGSSLASAGASVTSSGAAAASSSATGGTSGAFARVAPAGAALALGGSAVAGFLALF